MQLKLLRIASLLLFSLGHKINQCSGCLFVDGWFALTTFYINIAQWQQSNPVIRYCQTADAVKVLMQMVP